MLLYSVSCRNMTVRPRQTRPSARHEDSLETAVLALSFRDPARVETYESLLYFSSGIFILSQRKLKGMVLA